MNDEFFYTGFGGADHDRPGTALVGGYAADGWFKMFEFFEVPSQMIGAIGPVAQGTNFDWLRQDIKPGQLNLNLIIDEEVFFSVRASRPSRRRTVRSRDRRGTATSRLNPSDQFSQQLLNFNQIPPGCRSGQLYGRGSRTAPSFAGWRATPGPDGGHVDAGQRLAGLGLSASPSLPVAPPEWLAHRPDRTTSLSARQTTTATGTSADLQQRPQGGLGPVPDAAARRLGLSSSGSAPVAVGQNSAVTPVTPPQATPPAGQLRHRHPRRAAVPFAVVSRHRLHDHAAGRPAAVPVHQSRVPAALANTITRRRPPATASTYYAATRA